MIFLLLSMYISWTYGFYFDILLDGIHDRNWRDVVEWVMSPLLVPWRILDDLLHPPV